MRITFMIFIGLFSALPSVLAQDYRIKQFTVEDGLPSDIIKDISEDSLGFIWIACDEGLVKFDGFKFTTYKEALHSQYAKGFLKTRGDRLMAFADLDVVDIDNNLDTVNFTRLLPAARNITDSALWYPKSMFEDSRGRLWVGEPEAVTRWDYKTLKRFSFPGEESPIFLRSFTCFERAGDVFAVAFMGKAWRFDTTLDRFIPLAVQLPVEVADIRKVGDEIMIACGDGIYSLKWKGNELVGAAKEFPCMLASRINPVNDSTWFISTFGAEHYWMKIGKSRAFTPFQKRINNINRAYTSSTGDVWLASNEGVHLVQRNLFRVFPYSNQPGFIEGISEDRKREFIYFSNRIALYKAANRDAEISPAEMIYTDPSGYFQGLQYFGDRLWASNQYDVLVFENDRLIRTIDCSMYGRFIHDLYIDNEGVVWLSQANSDVVISITQDFEVHQHRIDLTPGSNVNVIRSGPQGIYAASNGRDGYLFLLQPGQTNFTNVSLPVTFEIEGDFNITDIAALDGELWLASTDGLLKYDHKTIKRVNVASGRSSLAVKSVEVYDNHNILFSNAYGLFLYNTVSGEVWQYEESNGLPSNTILARGIYMDKFMKVWAGTAKGIAYSTRRIDDRRKTPRPYCVEVLANGQSQRFTKTFSIPYNTFLSMEFSSISLPVNRLTMQYRWGAKDAWKTFRENRLTIAGLSSGIHALEIRAKKNGPYDWSEITSLTMNVGLPFWKRSWFILLSLITLGFISWAAYAIASVINQKRRAYLERLVSIRTNEINLINEELIQKNNELDRFVYSTSHDLSAPLKSILGLITLARMENPPGNHVSYLEMMERSVKKLEGFIKDVISYSRNARLAIKSEPIKFEALVGSLLDDHQFAPNFARIKFDVINEREGIIFSDETRLRIILNNLISNAIKFHDFGNPSKTPFVKITASGDETHLVITVQDNGRGIHENYVSHIFDMFFRATDSIQGSGLGLYIMRETVHKLGGMVEVSSVLGEGTQFCITFPQESNPSPGIATRVMTEAGTP